MLCYCFSESQIIQVIDHLSSNDQTYLQLTYGDLSSSFIVKTWCLDSLSSLVSQNEQVCVYGGKGVGKTYSLLFLTCCGLTANFVLLTQHTRDEDILKHLEVLEKKNCKFIIFA